MNFSFLTDKHVPSVFCTVLRSNGYTVVRAQEVFGEGTDDEELLGHCESEGHFPVTHDKKDFSSHESDAGVTICTDSNFLRDEPETAVRAVERVLKAKLDDIDIEEAAGTAVRAVERVLEAYPPAELRGEIMWLSQWMF